MATRWKRNRSPQIILDKLQRQIKVNDDGSFTLHSMAGYEDSRKILISMVQFPLSLCERDKNDIASRGIQNACKKKAFTEAAVLREIGIELNNFRKRETSQYYLFTTINFGRPLPFKRVSPEGCTISFIESMPRKVALERRKVLKSEIRPKETFYSIVRIRTKGKSRWEAVDKALFSLNLFRGICNLALNKSWRKSFGPLKPVNELRLGKYQTLHNLDLSNVDDNQYWFEPDYFEDSPRRLNDQEKVRLVEYVNNFRQLLSKSKYSAQLKKAIVRYNSALDLTNKNSAFISLFSILETLTASGGRNFDVTIRRTKFHYKDPVYAQETLEHIRTFRNEFIHEGSFDDNIENDLYQLKRFVEVLIHFHIGYSAKFSTLQEAGEFMDLPIDKQTLRRRSNLINLGIDYLND